MKALTQWTLVSLFVFAAPVWASPAKVEPPKGAAPEQPGEKGGAPLQQPFVAMAEGFPTVFITGTGPLRPSRSRLKPVESAARPVGGR